MPGRCHPCDRLADLRSEVRLRPDWQVIAKEERGKKTWIINQNLWGNQRWGDYMGSQMGSPGKVVPVSKTDLRKGSVLTHRQGARGREQCGRNEK